MPEKGENHAKNDDLAAPAARAKTAAVAVAPQPPPQKRAAGLHKRVLSAAHSLMRGVRSSRSVSTGIIIKHTSIPAARKPARPTTSAPARKPQGEQKHPLPPQDASAPLAINDLVPRSRTAPSRLPYQPKRNLKTPEVVAAEEEEEQFCDFEDNGGFFFPENHPADFLQNEEEEAPFSFRKNDQPQQKPNKKKEEEEPRKAVQMKDIIQELEIDNVLKEALPDGYLDAIKTSLRKIAVHCNELNQPESAEDWQNVAQRLSEKLLLLKSNFSASIKNAPCPLHLAVPAVDAREQKDCQQQEQLLYGRTHQQPYQHRYQNHSFNWQAHGDTEIEAAKDFMDFLPCSPHNEIQDGDGKRSQQQQGREEYGSEGSSPLLSLNSADFEFD